MCVGVAQVREVVATLILPALFPSGQYATSKPMPVALGLSEGRTGWRDTLNGQRLEYRYGDEGFDLRSWGVIGKSAEEFIWYLFG